MKWAAMNALGMSAWLLGIFYARPMHPGLLGIVADGERQFTVALACAAVGAAILLWANLRSSA